MLAFAHHRVKVQNKRRMSFSFETEQKVQHTSCGAIYGSTVVLIDEGESEQGQVLLIGGLDEHGVASSAVDLVDLATGVCTAQASLLSPQGGRIGSWVAERLLDGRIVCAGATWHINGSGSGSGDGAAPARLAN
jgi:hypothetical protein